MTLTMTQLGLTQENYHPDHCNVTSYKLAFIHGSSRFLVHGLWPEGCCQCTTCSYPTCCQMDKFSNFVMPKNTDFIDHNWYGGQSHMDNHVCGMRTYTLFEHEVLKHGSCMGLDATGYMSIVAKVYERYYMDLDKLCVGKRVYIPRDPDMVAHTCELSLNEDFTLA